MPRNNREIGRAESSSLEKQPTTTQKGNEKLEKMRRDAKIEEERRSVNKEQELQRFSTSQKGKSKMHETILADSSGEFHIKDPYYKYKHDATFEIVETASKELRDKFEKYKIALAKIENYMSDKLETADRDVTLLEKSFQDLDNAIKTLKEKSSPEDNTHSDFETSRQKLNNDFQTSYSQRKEILQEEKIKIRRNIELEKTKVNAAEQEKSVFSSAEIDRSNTALQSIKQFFENFTTDNKKNIYRTQTEINSLLYKVQSAIEKIETKKIERRKKEEGERKKLRKTYETLVSGYRKERRLKPGQKIDPTKFKEWLRTQKRNPEEFSEWLPKEV